MRHRQSGSLLVEISLAMMAMGALALVAVPMLSGTKKNQDRALAGNSLMLAEQAVRTFILREKRLPCPDPVGGGYEARDADGQCPPGLATGFLPYAALQLDKPAIDGVVRYGVWRGAGADLANRAASTVADGASDGSQQLLDALARALKSPPGTALPYVARLNGQLQHVDCTAASDNPAFVMAVQASASVAGSALCFADDRAAGNQVRWVGRQELLGWAKFRFSG